MNSIEQMRWAKKLIEEKTSGLQELVVGNVHDDLYIRTSDKATVGLYLSVLLNRSAGRYDCVFKGYTRTCGGYNDSIFHYTSLRALSRLCVKTSKFQMGNPAYLNDPQEGKKIKELVKKNGRCEKELKGWEYLIDNEEMIDVSNTYIASFVTDGNERNQLPMWIQYGDNGKGCRLEFSPSSVRLPLYRVNYEDEVMQDRIDKIIG